MARKKTPPSKKTGGRNASADDSPAAGEEDIAELEKMALERTNKALSAIENALAVWDATEDRGEEMGLRISRLKAIHNDLANWEKKVLKSMSQREDLQERIERLRDFSDICYRYGNQ